MKKNVDITKPRYREQILPVPSTEALRHCEGIALLVTCYVTQTQQDRLDNKIKNVPSNTCIPEAPSVMFFLRKQAFVSFTRQVGSTFCRLRGTV